MADFIAGVNRLLRINTIIKGDDDAITTFSDTQHAADIQLAQIAIQSELTSLIAERLLDYEKTSSTISLVTGTRTYALNASFIRFYGSRPSFYDATTNTRYYEHPGGEDALMNQDWQYKTATGGLISWYWHSTTTKQVAFYNVPDSSFNGRSLSYEYEASVMVSNSTDTLPFPNNEEYYAFIDMAARRFKFLVNKTPVGELDLDATYSTAKSTLYNLMRPTNPSSSYGKRYG
jgi:hypothetical protein